MLEAQIAQKASFSSTLQTNFLVNPNPILMSIVTVLPWREKKRT